MIRLDVLRPDGTGWFTPAPVWHSPGQAIEYARANAGAPWRVLLDGEVHSTGCGKKILTTKARTATDKWGEGGPLT